MMRLSTRCADYIDQKVAAMRKRRSANKSPHVGRDYLRPNGDRAMGQLIALLDQLEAHLSSEIVDADIAAGLAG